MFQALRPSILSKLIFSLREMVNGPVIAVGIWILGEYCEVNARNKTNSSSSSSRRDSSRHIRRALPGLVRRRCEFRLNRTEGQKEQHVARGRRSCEQALPHVDFYPSLSCCPLTARALKVRQQQRQHLGVPMYLPYLHRHDHLSRRRSVVEDRLKADRLIYSGDCNTA